MNIIMALSLFSLIILIYWVITELFTTLFRFTGLPDEKARFQVISLLTGCGFTTKESELILTTRSRRRIARVTMLFGYVFNITIVSAFINVFISLKTSQIGNFILGVPIPIAAVVLIVIGMRVPRFRAWIDAKMQRLADRFFTRSEGFNAVLTMDHIGTDAIALVTLREIPEQYQGKTLVETGLRTDTGILVMLVEHCGKKAEAAGADTVFEVGDKITVFGDYATICRAFHAREHFSDQ